VDGAPVLTTAPRADPVALRQELQLREPVDIRSAGFQRFVIRLSESLDVDIAPDDYAQLATLGGCSEYIGRLHPDAPLS
jgi:hypothetical protein